MSVERNVRVDFQSEENVSEKTRQIAASMDRNLNRALEKSAKQFEKTYKATQSFDKSLRESEKQVVVLNNNLMMLNDTSISVADSITKVSQATRPVDANVKKMNQSTEQATSTMEALAAKTQMAITVVSAVGDVVNKAADVFVSLVGHEKAFMAIRTELIKMSNVVDGFAQAMLKLGGPFNIVGKLLVSFREMLRQDETALVVLAAATEGVDGGLSELNKSFGDIIANGVTLTTKMRLGGIAMQQYGKAIASADGVLNQLKGTTIAVAGHVSEFAANTIDRFSFLDEAVIGFAGSFLAVAGIDKLFTPVNKAIDSMTISMIGAQNRAAAMSVQVGQTTTFMNGLRQSFQSFKSTGLNAAVNGLNVFKGLLTNTRGTLSVFMKTVTDTGKLTAGLTGAFAAASTHTELFHKGLAGVITRAGLASSAFAALGGSLVRSDSVMAKMSGVTLLALSAAMGGAVFVVNQLLNAFGNLLITMGDKLTAASFKQIEAFSEFEKTTFAFNQTIQAYSKNQIEASKNTEMWTKFQQELTDTTGTTTATVQALIAETISATEAYHLNNEEMKTLIKRSIDLSERAHKPAIETLTGLISAMNGAGQSVIALGLHMNDTAIEHSKLTAEQKELFKTADDVTKGQLRYKVLMEQAGKAADFASDNANLYSKALKLQKNAQESLNAALGKGAEIINGEVIFGMSALTNAMTNFLGPVLPAAGFVQALGGHLLTLTGIIGKNVLGITLLISSYQALNVLLAKAAASNAFAQTLPFINKSVIDIAKNLGATTLSFSSIGKVGKASFEIIGKQTSNAFKAMIGLEATTKLTAKTLGTQMVKGLKSVVAGIRSVTAASFKFIASPLGLTIIAVAAAAFLLFKAFQKLEKETGIFSDIWTELTASFGGTSSVIEPLLDVFKQMGVIFSRLVGIHIKLLAAGLAFVAKSVLNVVKAVQIASQMLPEGMRVSDEAIARTEKRIQKLDDAMSNLAGSAANDFFNLFVSNAEAMDRVDHKLLKFQKDLESANSVIGKFGEKMKKSTEEAAEFTPKINLSKFTKEITKLETQAIEFQGALEEKKIVLLNAPAQTEEVQKMLDDTLRRIEESEEVIQGLRLKRAQETRRLKLQEVDMELEMRFQKVFTIEEEIKKRRIESERDIRDAKVDILTQQLIEEQGLRQQYIGSNVSIEQEAAVRVKEMRLQNFRDQLETEKTLALTFEQEKQLEIANLRASLAQGTTAGAQAQEDAEVLREKQKIQQLKMLREQQLISEKQFQESMTSVRLAGMQRRQEMEIAMEEQRIQMLGLSPEALQARLELQKQQDAMELEQLRFKLQNRMITEQEFEIAKNEMVLNSEARRSEIQQQHLQKEIQRNKMRGDNWNATLKSIELAQQQHGVVMGTLQGVQQSMQFQAIQNGLSSAASLMQSERKKEFELGKKAAIAQTIVNTFMSATAAYAALAGIPIVGPFLATAAAAAAVLAGMMNVRRIKAQQFQGGGGAGSTAAPTAATPPTGGQADSGMDAVPRSLGGKTFILSAGERVVQPTANRDLTGFLNRVNNGDQQIGGNSVNITINGNVNNPDDAKMMADMVLEELRARSERGEPVISSRGIA